MFFFSEDSKKEAFSEGILLQRLGGTENINAVHWNFEDGEVVETHHHHQEQFGYVLKGAFVATIGNETKTLTAGDAYFIAPNIPHRFVAVGKTEAIDVFTPRREVG